MAVPKNKIGKSTSRSRRAANMKMKAVNLMECPQCHSRKEPHKVCMECGYYNGKEVISVE